jgi:hypothetical protein
MNRAQKKYLKINLDYSNFKRLGRAPERGRTTNKMKCIDILNLFSFSNKYFQRTHGSHSYCHFIFHKQHSILIRHNT